MRIRLKEGAKSLKVKSRRYNGPQRKFMNEYIKRLLRNSFAEKCSTAAWQPAPLIVPKPVKKNEFRMAADLRPINSVKIKESWSMPHLDGEVADFSESEVFAVMHFVAAYWKLGLHPDSKELCGIITSLLVVVAKLVLQGLANSTSYFQSSVKPLFSSIRKNLHAYLDDFSLHSKTEEGILETTEEFFSICKEHNLFLSARKCKFFQKSLKWFGRVISKDGYTLEQYRLSGLQDIKEPETGAALAQFIYCTRWMSNCLPNFSRVSQPLIDILEEAFKKSGKRTKRSIKNIKLATSSWGEVHSNAYNELQDMLRNQVKLSYPKPDMVTCMFTDASDHSWAEVVTQVPPEDLEKNREDQRHKPLAFIVSKFTGS